ncbi:hypothetical protein LWI29_018519 [Acer saccharum]|uniref:RNase H type-1 domain-containing protein n=1 Tax=Acer saccharum TaxID=4024 RepID=A0AA39T0I4_ACESA|nr:hypothetical protein LWI29_018519 [Acer saccharum]
MVIHLHAKVSDFIRDGRRVLEDRFHARFPDLYFRIEKIAITPMNDYLVWPHSKDERSVWYSRNQWIFDGKLVDFRDALSLIWRSVYDTNRLGIGCMCNYVDDLMILHQFGLSGCPGKAHVIRSVVWSPRLRGGLRYFVKACFAVPLVQVFAFEAELLAASLAFNYVWELGWHRIWLKIDSSYMVQLLSDRSDKVTFRVRQAWQSCIYQILHMEFQVSHIFREGNQVADALSKHALGVPSDLWWSSTPSLCSRLVGNDYMGRESFKFS